MTRLTDTDISKDVEEIIQIVESLPPIKDRLPKFKRPDSVKTSEESYLWLVNEWMPTQPDFEKLVRLTVLLNFHMSLVMAALISPGTFEREINRKLGKEIDV